MGSPPISPLEPLLYELVASLQPARRAWLQAANVHFVGTGLPAALTMAIVVIGRLGGAAQHKALAAELGVGPTSLVRTVDQGEAAGLLARTHMPDDRRGKLVALTAAGRAQAERMEAQLGDLRAHLLRDVPREDIKTAIRVLRLFGDRGLAHAAEAERADAEPQHAHGRPLPRAGPARGP
jgi:MarR family transcriptional regulator, transcriptional regulator for hemolysin